MTLQCVSKRSDAADHLRISLGTLKWVLLLVGLGFVPQD